MCQNPVGISLFNPFGSTGIGIQNIGIEFPNNNLFTYDDGVQTK